MHDVSGSQSQSERQSLSEGHEEDCAVAFTPDDEERCLLMVKKNLIDEMAALTRRYLESFNEMADNLAKVEKLFEYRQHRQK